jgi:hypothetical protein
MLVITTGIGIAQECLWNSARKAEHVGSPGRAEILLLNLEIADSIIFQVRMVARRNR